MAERKLVVYYESRHTIDEEKFLDYVHEFFCENPNDNNMNDCPLFAMTLQDVVVEES